MQFTLWMLSTPSKPPHPHPHFMQDMGLPPLGPDQDERVHPYSDDESEEEEDDEEEEEEDGEEGGEDLPCPGSDLTGSTAPRSTSLERRRPPPPAPRQQIDPSDLQPMMDMLDEVERSCLGKSEAAVRSSVRASVDRCVYGGEGGLEPEAAVRCSVRASVER